MPTKNQIRDAVSSAEWKLRTTGSYRMSNSEPGLAHAVLEELNRLFPNGGVTLDKPSFGGEASFKSANHLGTKE